MKRLAEIGEFGLIERLTRNLDGRPELIHGVGDDCCVLRVGGESLLLSCDAAIEQVHFQRSYMPPRAIGWRTAMAAWSDIAAMGGEARCALVALACSPDESVDFLDQVFAGLREATAACGGVIGGGDTTRSERDLFLDVSVVGVAESRYLPRAGAKPGDLLAVTGALGGSAGGLLALQQGLAAPGLAARHCYPEARMAAGRWLAADNAVHAMIDCSDGLLRDAGHLAHAAGLGADLDPAAVPVHPDLADFPAGHGVPPEALALTSGEEYELIFALDASARERLPEALKAATGLRASVIGSFSDAWRGVRVAGEEPSLLGYDHFKGNDTRGTT